MHSKTIKCKRKQLTVEQQKNSFTENYRHQLLKNKNSEKKTIHNTLKIRQKYFYIHPSKFYVSYG